jgi:L-ascorbate metabolism protein UlaG (beta-lactamase superfamily)
MNRLKTNMLLALLISAVLAGGIWLFLQSAVFGAVPTGARQARIEQSANYRDGAFQNLVSTDVMRPGASPLKMIRDLLTKPANVTPPQPMPSVKTDLNALPANETTIVWFGHSSYLIRSGGYTLLVDPVFSGSASPLPFSVQAFAGADAYSVADMPPIDVLVLTHDHYDHLDYQTLTKLLPTVKHVCTSLGVGAHLERWGYNPAIITELDWGQTDRVADSLTLTAAPARHFSGRSIKRGQSLWSAFVLNVGGKRLFLGGDSGYGPHFRQLGQQYGPFDLALLECGQYGQDWPSIHTLPNEIVQAAQDLKTEVLMPVHWGKFALAFHAWNGPIQELTALAGPANLRLTTPRIGEPVVLGKPLPNQRWW